MLLTMHKMAKSYRQVEESHARSSIDCMELSHFSLLKPFYYLSRGSLSVQIKSGGHLLLFCMSDANKDPYTGPERISRTQLEELFSVQTTDLTSPGANMWQCANVIPSRKTGGFLACKGGMLTMMFQRAA